MHNCTVHLALLSSPAESSGEDTVTFFTFTQYSLAGCPWYDPTVSIMEIV